MFIYSHMFISILLLPKTGMKKMNKGPSFKINSVSINAQAILKAEEDMKPLADVMPDSKDDRKTSVVDFVLKLLLFWDYGEYW